MSNGMRVAGVLAALAVGVPLVAGCSSEPAPVVFHDGDLPDVSRAVEYGSVEQLAKDSTSVVVVSAASANPQRDDQGFYVVPLRVAQDLKGAVTPGSTIMVRTEVPDPDSEGTPLLASDHTFLLFVTPLDFGDGVVRSEYVVTGYLSGYYVESADDEFVAIDPDRNELPADLTLASVERSL